MVVVCNKPLHMLATLTNYLRPSRYFIALDSTKSALFLLEAKFRFSVARQSLIIRKPRQREILFIILTNDKQKFARIVFPYLALKSRRTTRYRNIKISSYIYM